MGEMAESELKAADGREFDLERDEVRLLDYDPDTEIRLVAAALYPYSIDPKRICCKRP